MEILIALEIAVVLAVIYYFFIAPLFRTSLDKVNELKNKKMYQEALNLLLKMYAKNKDDSRVIYELALLNKEVGNFLEAIGYYLKLYERDSYPPVTSKADVLKDIGLLYFKSGNIKEAFYFLYYASYLLPNDMDINYTLFKILMSLEAFVVAESFGIKASPFLSKDPEFVFLYSLVKIQLNKYSEVLEAIEKVKVKDEKLKIIISFVLAKLGGYKRAVDILSSIITQLEVPQEVLALIYKIIIFCEINQKSLNESLKYWDMFLALATTKGWSQTITEIGFGIFVTYLYFNKYDNARDMLYTLKGYNVDNVTISSIESFIEDAIKNSELKSQGKPYDLRPFREIEKFVEGWLGSLLKPDELWRLFGQKIPENQKFDVYEIVKQVQEKVKLGERKLQKELGRSLSIDESEDICDVFANRLDSKTFYTICEELVKALGFSIITKIDLPSFVETEGLDFVCSRIGEKIKYYVAIRRWPPGNEIGKIPILDLSQRSSEKNCDKLVFITTSPLTQEASDFVEKSGRIEVIMCKDIAPIIKNILPSI